MNTKQVDKNLTTRKKDNRCLVWLKERKDTTGITASSIRMADARCWQMTDGCIKHETGGFFSIVGVRAISSDLPSHGVEQPIILQPEIGILGVLVTKTANGVRILIQAKAEPGNVGNVQLAPTVQATVSNYTCVHGGRPTAYLDYFLNSGSWGVPADSRQSEQGTRFLGKYNRNMTVLLNGETPDPISDVWRWFDMNGLLKALKDDFSVNTDLRSVLATSDWSVLSREPVPFEGWRGKGGFGEVLYESCAAEKPTDQILARLRKLRDNVKLNLTIVPIQDLGGWCKDKRRIVDNLQNNFEVSFFRVNSPDREVTDWDQPLIRDLGQGEVIMVGQKRKGILHFLFRGSVEPGFREKVQYGPVVQKPPVKDKGSQLCPDEPIENIILSEKHVQHLSCMLSEEGGRFFRSISRYRVIEFPEEVEFPEQTDCCWMTLGQVRQLLQVPGVFTNEARSAIALLLSWLPGPE